MLTSEHTTAALGALCSARLLVDSIEFDGVLHRVPTVDKPNSKNGAYIAYSDAPASLWWADWASGESGTWTAKGESTMTTSEKAELSRRMEASRKAREAEQARLHAAAASRAKGLYGDKTNTPHGKHYYLKAKGVTPVSGLKMRGGRLIVPIYDENGALVSLQFVDDDGNKRFLTGGRKRGCFFPIGGKDAEKPLLICEGLATGLSLHESLDRPVLVAFDAGNLLPVAEMARSKYPDREIILCADYDDPDKSNPDPGGVGVAKATAAAVAVGGSLAVPRHEGRAVDWNDLHRLMGAGEVRTQFMMHSKPEPAAVVEGEKEKLPSGFSLRTGGTLPGLWHTEVKDEGDPVETWIGAPLHVLGLTRDETSNAWGLLLEWHDQDSIRHTWAMPLSFLQGRDLSTLLSRLADGGWRGSAGNKAKQLLALYLASYRTDRRALCVPCTGWHRDVYVLPDNIIGFSAGRAGRAGRPYGDKAVNPSSNENGLLDVLDGEQIVLQVQTPQNPFRMAGTLDGWRDTIGEWSRGNSRLMLALCASFAAPLLEVTGLDSGGFNWMGQSSTGKTTALVAAGSLWGKGSSSGGYVQNWRATANGLEGIAALHSDAALCLDEIGQAPGRTIQEAAYMLANGMGKARAYQDGSARVAKNWRCMVLSTGEKGLAEKITEEGGRVQAGQTVRLVDIPADAGASLGIFENLHGHESSRVFADVIKNAAAVNYGHAARAFIAEVQKDRERIQASLHTALTNAGAILCPAGASGQVERVARRFALCAAAGEMAAEWGLVPWGKGEAFQAIKKCFDAWLVLRGGAGAAEDSAIYEQIMLFIEQHGASRFQDVSNVNATVVNRAGFRRQTDGGGTEYFILPGSFKQEVCKGIDHKHAATILMEHGVLAPGDSRSLTRRPPVDLPGYGRKRCYTLFIGGGDNDELA